MPETPTTDALRELAERGTPRGAEAIYRAAAISDLPALDPDPGTGPLGPDRSRGRRVLVAAAIVVAMVVAAGFVALRRSDPSDVTFGATTTVARDLRAELLGRYFMSTAITEHGAPKELYDHTAAELRFDDDELRTIAGCDFQFYRWSVDGDVLIVDPTLRSPGIGACVPAEREGNTWLMPFLQSRPRIVADGRTLRLITTDSELVLQARDPTDPLEGTLWTLDRVTAKLGGPRLGIPADELPTLELRDGVALLWTGCARTTFRYTLTRAPWTQLRMAVEPFDRAAPPECPDGRRQVHDALVAMLHGRTMADGPDSPLIIQVLNGLFTIQSSDWICWYAALPAPPHSR